MAMTGWRPDPWSETKEAPNEGGSLRVRTRLRDADETRLIGQVQRHAKEAHDLDLNVEQVLAMMEIEQE